MSDWFEKWHSWRKEQSRYPGQGTFAGIVYCALGLGEAGELIGEVKKAWRDDRGSISDERTEKIILELGDVLWYVDAMCEELNVSLEEVATANRKKIEARKAHERSIG